MHANKLYMCREKMVGEGCYPPLLSYLEAVPESYEVREEDILRNVSGDGSIFQSPSATAKAFMATRNKDCLNYLKSLAQRCANNGGSHIYLLLISHQSQLKLLIYICLNYILWVCKQFHKHTPWMKTLLSSAW